MAKTQDERWEHLRAERAQLRKLSKTAWYVWKLTETPQFTWRAVRAAVVMLGWPYVMPDAVDDEWLKGSLDMGPLNTYWSNTHETRHAMARQTGFTQVSVNNIGRMFAMRYEFHGQGGPHHYLVTPPVYKFCDLDKEFPEASPVLRPWQFWIQPQVFEHAGEVLHGAPWHRDILHHRSVTPRNLHAMLAIESEFQTEIEWMLVALDNWLERYERTGQTEVDTRFGWTWAEERVRAVALRDARCSYVDDDGQQCSRAPAYRYGLASMQSTDLVCAPHAALLANNEPGVYHFDPIVPPPSELAR